MTTMTNAELTVWVQKTLESNNHFSSNFSNGDLHQLVSCIDLTTLNATDSHESVKNFMNNGLEKLKENKLPEVAAFCVFSNFTELTKKTLKDTSIKTACVAAAFPHGQAGLGSKVTEVTDAALNGADEIDIVINRGLVLDGNYNQMEKEIVAFKSSSGIAHLKSILEVCELDLSQVYETSKRAINAGSDFIKTSTGKGKNGASLEASLVMCKAIKEHFNETGLMVGFKAAGGISTSADAMRYYNLVGFILGEKWQNNTYFRIGASSLLQNIISDLK